MPLTPKDPALAQMLNNPQNWKYGVIPAPSFGGGVPAAEGASRLAALMSDEAPAAVKGLSNLQVVEPTPPEIQVNPSAEGVDEAIANLKQNLQNVPTGTRGTLNAIQSPSTPNWYPPHPGEAGAGGAMDLLSRPGAQAAIQRLAAGAKPVMDGLTKAGAFLGDRTVGGIGGLK